MNKVQQTVRRIAPLDTAAMAQAQQRLDSLTKPPGSLGRLEGLAKQLAGISGSLHPALASRTVFTLAADHGIAAQGVSAYPPEVTWQMVRNFLAGGAAINVLARHSGCRVVVADLGVKEEIGQSHPDFVRSRIGAGTRDFSREPAMSREQALASVKAGIDLLNAAADEGVHVVGVGEMGIGNTTSASAIVSCITATAPAVVTGRGTGVSDEGMRRKIQLIETALGRHTPDPADPLDVLAKVGGYEIGGMAGIMLAAAARRIPVVLDGFISGTAALLAQGFCAQSVSYMIASHLSVEPGHRLALGHVGLRPLFDLSLRLGEGTGAVLALSLLDASIRILNEMATFSDAAVSGPSGS